MCYNNNGCGMCCGNNGNLWWILILALLCSGGCGGWGNYGGGCGGCGGGCGCGGCGGCGGGCGCGGNNNNTCC